MDAPGIVRRLGDLGRVVLPVEVRKRLNWDTRDGILFSLDSERGTIILTLSEKYSRPECIFCGADEWIVKVNGSDICADCVEKVKAI